MRVGSEPKTEVRHTLGKTHTFLSLQISTLVASQVMKTYHMYNTDSMNAESKLKDAEKQEEKQMGRSDRQTPRSPDTLSSIKTDEKPVRRSSVKKIEKMKEKVRGVERGNLSPSAPPVVTLTYDKCLIKDL